MHENTAPAFSSIHDMTTGPETNPNVLNSAKLKYALFAASIYNAMPVEGVEKLVEFMKKFEEAHQA